MKIVSLSHENKNSKTKVDHLERKVVQLTTTLEKVLESLRSRKTISSEENQLVEALKTNIKKGREYSSKTDGEIEHAWVSDFTSTSTQRGFELHDDDHRVETIMDQFACASSVISDQDILDWTEGVSDLVPGENNQHVVYHDFKSFTD